MGRVKWEGGVGRVKWEGGVGKWSGRVELIVQENSNLK